MKTKISVTLSESIVAEVDRLAPSHGMRSAIIEEALREYLANRARRARDARELKILNEHADELNAEMEDFLSLQFGDSAS